MGSLGFEIGYRTAQVLGYRLYHREVINQAAIRAGVPDVALAAIDELGLFGISPSIEASEAYRTALETVINEIAQTQNAVIIGRGGQIILHNVPNTLHVRVIAPIRTRIERIAQRQTIRIDQAVAQVNASDKFRSRYLKRYFNIRWDDPFLYDLIINTQHISADLGVEMIIRAHHSLIASS